MKKKIYLSGGMADISFEESNLWRKYLEEELRYDADVFNPNFYYNYKDDPDTPDSEVMWFDLHKLKESDVVVVNFNVPKSIGTAYEVAVAHEHGIPIIGLNEKYHELHPWLYESCWKMFDEMDDMISYLKAYYLN